MKKKQQNKKRTYIQYAIFAIIAITLYTTGKHTDVIGFLQRGVLATGLLNPDVEEVMKVRDAIDTDVTSGFKKADLNFKLKDREGEVLSLEALKGKVIFLNLWATWCPPCVAEMPSIDELHEAMGKEVAFIILSLDEDFKTAIAFDKRKGYNLPIYTLASPLPSMYNSTSIPTTYIIDADGNLVLTHKSMANYNSSKFKKFLNSLK